MDNFVLVGSNTICKFVFVVVHSKDTPIKFSKNLMVFTCQESQKKGHVASLNQNQCRTAKSEFSIESVYVWSGLLPVPVDARI